MTATAPIESISSPDGQHAAQLARAVVVTVNGATIHVRAGTRRRSCTVATSCLIMPAPGDQVLMALEGDAGGWILAVLERPGEAPLRIALDRDAEIASAGVLRLMAAEGIELVSRKHTRLTTKTLEVSAQLAEAALARVTTVGDQLRSHFSKVSAIADELDVVAERAIMRFQRRYQFIEETDQLRAKHVDLRAEKTMALRGEHTVLTAHELVKVDADQIHVG